MGVLNWGEPTIEFAKLTSDSPGEFTSFGEIVQGTTALETTEGDETEALDEGGAVVDSRKDKNRYSLTFTLFVKRGDTRPIDDNDGVITDNYAVRLTPEDDTLPGFIMDKCSVSVVETWTAADGSRLTYTFRGLKPKTGKILKPYTRSSE